MGISKNKSDPHAFIQLFLTPTMEVHYCRYDLNDFSIVEEPFQINIQNNTFSLDEIHVALDDQEFSFKADLRLFLLSSIHRSWLAPNMMGMFAYLPKVEAVDPTAAGDAFTGALAKKYAETKDIVASA